MARNTGKKLTIMSVDVCESEWWREQAKQVCISVVISVKFLNFGPFSDFNFKSPRLPPWFLVTSSLGLLDVVQVTAEKWAMEISKPAQGLYIWFCAPGNHSLQISRGNSWGLVFSLACLLFLCSPSWVWIHWDYLHHRVQIARILCFNTLWQLILEMANKMCLTEKLSSLKW